MEMAETIGEVMIPGEEPATLEKLQGLCSKEGRDRNTHLRKEQLSQGVLSAMLRTLGRYVLEQVPTHSACCKHNNVLCHLHIKGTLRGD